MLTQCLEEHVVVAQSMIDLLPQIKIDGAICIKALES